MTNPTPPAPLEPGRTIPRWQPHAPLVLAAALLGLRAAYLPWINLFPEEAYYWNYAQHLDIGYLDHPPMVAWLIALSTRVFGETEFGVRALSLGCSVLTSFLSYRLAALFYDIRTGAVAALLVQLLPFFFMTGWIMTPDAPLTACWAGTLYFLAEAIFEPAAGAWLKAGVWLGLGMLSKYTVVLLGPAALLFLMLDPPSRVWLRRPAPYLAVLLALAIFSPVIVWNAGQHWASFAFQSTGRLQQPHRFGLPALVGSILLMLTPVGIFMAARSWPQRTAAAAIPEHPAKYRIRLFAWVFTLVPLSVFVVFSLTHRVKLNWTGPLWLALVPALAAQTVLAAGSPSRGPALRQVIIATAAVLAVVYAGLLQYLSFGVPGLRQSGNIVLLPVGWPQMADELARQQAEVRARTGGRVLIVGMDKDFIASECAFYHPRRAASVQEVTGAHLFGDESLMYAHWFPPAAQDGASLVLASFNERWLDSGPVREHCDGLQPVQSHFITNKGQIVCTYYTRVVQRYHSRFVPHPQKPPV